MDIEETWRNHNIIIVLRTNYGFLKIPPSKNPHLGGFNLDPVQPLHLGRWRNGWGTTTWSTWQWANRRIYCRWGKSTSWYPMVNNVNTYIKHVENPWFSLGTWSRNGGSIYVCLQEGNLLVTIRNTVNNGIIRGFCPSTIWCKISSIRSISLW